MSGLRFPSISEMEKAGFHESRIGFIELLRMVYNGDGKFKNSIPNIIEHFNFSKKTEKGRSMDRALITSILTPGRNNTSDKISGISFKDIYQEFSEKFSSNAVLVDFEAKEKVGHHDDYYIYYYESYDENKKRYSIKFALFGFNIDKKNKEWASGTVYYFQDNLIHKIFDLKKVEPKEYNPDTLFFIGKYESQINFYTIKINKRKIDSRGILPLTYSVLETQFGYPCAGKAILEFISDKNYKKRVSELLNPAVGIDYKIINSLYLNKYVSDEPVFDRPEEFVNPQTEIFKDLIGLWEGTYFRLDIKETNSKDEGGVFKFAFYIKESGECELFYDKPDQNDHSYKGFIEVPFEDKTTMKVYLDYLKEEKTHKICLFLSAETIGAKRSTYGGVIAGWANHAKRVYASSIYLKPISDYPRALSKKELLAELGRILPKRVVKAKIKSEFSPEEFHLLEILKNLEFKYLSASNNCTQLTE